MPITVSIVEDHDQTCATIVARLRRSPGLKLLDAYPTAEAALAGVPDREPDVLLVDIRLPKMSGIQCVMHLKSSLPNLRVLMLTTYEERELIFDSLLRRRQRLHSQKRLDDGVGPRRRASPRRWCRRCRCRLLASSSASFKIRRQTARTLKI